MNVTDSVISRSSTRAFLPTPIDDATIQKLLETASRAPSGGNLQPWRIYVVNGSAMETFKQLQLEASAEEPEYEMYPPNLIEPYRSSRFELGEAMYPTMGIGRTDKASRLAHLARNFKFFDAPAAIFCFADRTMGPPQWSDLGMFLQTFMLLATEAGISSCAQESWSLRPRLVASFVGAPDNEMLFCGVAIGQRDDSAPVNSLKSERRPFDEWAKFVR